MQKIRHSKTVNQGTDWKVQQPSDAMNQLLHISKAKGKKREKYTKNKLVEKENRKKRKRKTSEMSLLRELNAHSTYRSINCNRRHFSVCQFMKNLSI